MFAVSPVHANRPTSVWAVMSSTTFLSMCCRNATERARGGSGIFWSKTIKKAHVTVRRTKVDINSCRSVWKQKSCGADLIAVYDTFHCHRKWAIIILQQLWCKVLQNCCFSANALWGWIYMTWCEWPNSDFFPLKGHRSDLNMRAGEKLVNVDAVRSHSGLLHMWK